MRPTLPDGVSARWLGEVPDAVAERVGEGVGLLTRAQFDEAGWSETRTFDGSVPDVGRFEAEEAGFEAGFEMAFERGWWVREPPEGVGAFGAVLAWLRVSRKGWVEAVRRRPWLAEHEGRAVAAGGRGAAVVWVRVGG